MKKNKENLHNFLSEELLVPFVDKTDAQRLNMEAAHIKQALILKNGEFPKVFTNFENQIGDYSVAYKKAEENFTVIRKIVKNPMNYSLIVQYESGLYDIINVNKARNITEDYGYELVDKLPEDLAEGDVIEKDSMLYSSTSYDEYGNFNYGTNLKAVLLAYEGLTYEDIKNSCSQ